MKTKFAYTDMDDEKMLSDTKLVCQLTLRDGRIVYDLNGISMDVWNGKQTVDLSLAAHWTTFVPRPARPEQLTPTQR